VAASLPLRMTSLSRDYPTRSDRALSDFGLHRIAHFGRCRISYRTPCGLHWAWRELLPVFGAVVDEGRIVRDGNILSGGGVTAGIDFVLALIAETARIPRGGDSPTRLGICARTAVQLRAPGYGARRGVGSGERAYGSEPR